MKLFIFLTFICSLSLSVYASGEVNEVSSPVASDCDVSVSDSTVVPSSSSEGTQGGAKPAGSTEQ